MDSTFLLGDSGLIAAWAISIALTLLLIVPPVAYLALITLSMDDGAFDRTVSDIERHTEIKRNAQAYSSGKDVLGVLEESARVTPLSARQRGERASSIAAASS